MELVFGMPFLNLSNAVVVLQKGNLLRGLIPLQRSYLLLRRSGSLINGIYNDDIDERAFVVAILFMDPKILIHPAREAQIASLITQKVTVRTSIRTLPMFF